MAMTHEQVLSDLGFSADGSLKQEVEASAESEGLSESGAYVVKNAWSKGDVKVHLEQNTAPDTDGEMTALVTHPPLLVIEKGDARVAVSPRDTEALRAVITDLG